jgi:hypothetical protein
MESQDHPFKFNQHNDTYGPTTRLLNGPEQQAVASLMRLAWALENHVEVPGGQFNLDYQWLNEAPESVRAAVGEIMGTAYRVFSEGSAQADLSAFLDANVPGHFRGKNDNFDADCYPG